MANEDYNSWIEGLCFVDNEESSVALGRKRIGRNGRVWMDYNSPSREDEIEEYDLSSVKYIFLML